MLLLTGASVGVAVLPFRIAIRFGAVRLGRRSDASEEDAVWAVETASRLVPWRTVCIQKGLATQRILRAAGSDAILHYGARHASNAGKLEAHVWVTIDGHDVIGGEEAAAFAELAAYP